MKKTILATAAILLAGTALSNAASSIPADLQDNLIYSWDFSSGSAPTVNTPQTTWNDSFTYNAEGGYGSFGSNSVTPWADISGAGIYANNFTVSFDLANYGDTWTWKNLLSIYTGDGSYDTNCLALTRNTGENTAEGDGQLKVYTYSGFGGVSSAGGSAVLSDVKAATANNTWKTITITSDGTAIVAYVDGVLASSREYAATATVLTGMQFGTSFGDDPQKLRPINASVDVDNIAIWNTALSAEQVKTLIIPEPSAFGLLAGAGALALVAARRRRSRKA